MIREEFIEEFVRDGELINIEVIGLKTDDARNYIDMVLGKHSPKLISAHLSIGSSPKILKIPIKYEFKYSECLPNEPVYLFFDQYCKGREAVITIKNGKDIGKLEIFECYFLSNKTADYLVAVNEYAIEYKGDHPEWFDSLKK
jgi:hypothetical protein